MTELTQEKLKSILDYDPIEGTWKWRYRAEMSVQWNGHFANQPAGNIDSDTGYLRIRIGKLYYAHRLAFLYMTGEWPPKEVDHRNTNRSDCRWENLQPAEHYQNNANKSRQSNNTSGYKGVSFCKLTNLWVAELTVAKVRHRKRRLKSPEEAHAQYVEMVKKYCGEHGRIA